MFSKTFHKVMAHVLAPLLLIPVSAVARDIRTVEGSATYVVPRTVSLEDAENIALQRAIADALAAEFGTIVQTEVWTELINTNDQSSAEAWMNGLNLVKGEWLGPIGKPETSLEVSQEGYVVKVKVKGRAVAIESGNIDVRAAVKQVDSQGVHDADRFRSGNRLVVDFGSPVDGYVAIFLADAQADVVQLLPFAGESTPATAVSGGKKYRFFADNSGEFEEEYTLYTNDERERNILYILFSPKVFTRPFAEVSGNVRTVKAEEFRKWLIGQRAGDPNMQAIIKPLLIQR